MVAVCASKPFLIWLVLEVWNKYIIYDNNISIANTHLVLDVVAHRLQQLRLHRFHVTLQVALQLGGVVGHRRVAGQLQVLGQVGHQGVQVVLHRFVLREVGLEQFRVCGGAEVKGIRVRTRVQSQNGNEFCFLLFI